jgi:hypothetical protein
VERLFDSSQVRFGRENLGLLILFIICGSLLGSALGVFFAELIPSISIIKKNLISTGFDLGFLAMNFRLNLMSIIGIIAGVFIFAKA